MRPTTFLLVVRWVAAGCAAVAALCIGVTGGETGLVVATALLALIVIAFVFMDWLWAKLSSMSAASSPPPAPLPAASTADPQ